METACPIENEPMHGVHTCMQLRAWVWPTLPTAHPRRVLKGSSTERDMVLHLSPRMLDQPWYPLLQQALVQAGVPCTVGRCLAQPLLSCAVCCAAALKRAQAQAAAAAFTANKQMRLVTCACSLAWARAPPFHPIGNTCSMQHARPVAYELHALVQVLPFCRWTQAQRCPPTPGRAGAAGCLTQQ